MQGIVSMLWAGARGRILETEQLRLTLSNLQKWPEKAKTVYQ